MATTTKSNGSPLDSLAHRVDGDAVLRYLRGAHLRIGLNPLIPSGVDCTAAILARSVATESNPAIAIAVPRGRNPLSAFLALYFALGRMSFDGRRSYLPLSGSITLSTRDRLLRDIGGRLSHVGDRPSDDGLTVARMVPGRPDANGRSAPTAAELDASARLGGLSSADRHLLVHLPWFRPEVALNVISVSVVDATATRADGWPATYEWNDRARRRQVWVGELGDANFEEFCVERHVLLWRFDPGNVAYANELWGEGNGPLSTSELCRRRAPAAFGLRPVDDGEVNHELAQLDRCFASLHRKTKKLNEPPPAAVQTARQLYYLLGRIAAPVRVYDPIALATPRTMHTAMALKRVREAPPAQWSGPWRKMDQEWGAIRGGLTALHERVMAEDPKYFDLVQLIEEERLRKPRRKLVIRCSTRIEKQALMAALVADGMVSPEELDVDGNIDVRWFGALSPALPHGPASARCLTVLSDAPSPFRGSPYLTAEEGQFEALLYPVQQKRFRQLAVRTATKWCGALSNPEMLRALGFELNSHGLVPVQPPTITDLASFGLSGRKPVTDGDLGDSIDAMRDHWEEFIGLGSDTDETASSDAIDRTTLAVGGAAQPTRAILVVFEGGEHVFLPAEGKVDVVLRDDKLVPKPVPQLRARQNVVLIEGMERGSALTELFEAWEESYGPGQVYGELYRRALMSAIENAGGIDEVAAELGVTPRTVRAWRDGDTLAPGQEDNLRAVLELSGIEPAKQNYKGIRLYIKRVRGKHQVLGRIFNRAVSETLVDPGGPEQRLLEKETGLDVAPILASVRRLTVAYVIDEPRQVPRSALGRFLTVDHPLVKGTA